MSSSLREFERERVLLSRNTRDPTVGGLRDKKENCDAPKPGGPLTTRQPAEYKWMSGYPTPLQKIGQSLLCTGSSTQLQNLRITCPKQFNLITMIQIWIKTASWAHTTITIKTYQLYQIVLRVQIFTLIQHILKYSNSNTCNHHQSHTRLSSNPASRTSRPLARSLYL